MNAVERITSAEAAGTAVIAACSAAYFGRGLRGNPAPARRVAALVLCLVNAALAAEAVLYVAFLPPAAAGAEAAALVGVRTALLAGACSIAALILRRWMAGGGGR